MNFWDTIWAIPSVILITYVGLLVAALVLDVCIYAIIAPWRSFRRGRH